MLISMNNRKHAFCLAIICIAIFCGSCANGLHAKDKIKIDVYSNLYLSGNTAIGNVFEELVAGYHISEGSFIGAGFIHAGMARTLGGTLNYSYVKAWDTSLQLVPSVEAGVLYGKFSEDSPQAKFMLDLGVELRQWLGRKKSAFCGIGTKVLSIADVDISLWCGLTFGMSF